MAEQIMKMTEEEYNAYVKSRGSRGGEPNYPGDEMPAIKLDEGKLRYDLLPPLALDYLVRVYSHGCVKYADRNWEKGMLWGRVFAALMRHCWDWFRGENIDKESGLPHMAHAAWGCMALLEYGLRGRGEDDRPYKSGAYKAYNKEK